MERKPTGVLVITGREFSTGLQLNPESLGESSRRKPTLRVPKIGSIDGAPRDERYVDAIKSENEVESQ